MEYYYDEDDMATETNEYPDPDYTPSFAWLGVRNASPLRQHIGTLRNHAEPSISADGSRDGSPAQDQIYGGPKGERDVNRLSVDPDFQYQDDSDE